MGLIARIGTRAWAALVVAGLVALAVARGIGLIRRAERLERENTDLREGAAADRRMDHADRSSGDSDADADWLRRWAERRQRQRGRRAP
ncbi:hypothetical protein MASR2M74_36100 [Paracoccaceae bacterium]